MSREKQLAELEALVPWSRARFRQELAGVQESTAEQSRLRAGELRLLASLAAQVPRMPGDLRGGTPWASFHREVAVAARISDRVAAFRIRSAVRLTSTLPTVLAELEAGRVTVQRLEAFLRELEPYDDALAAALDRELGRRIGGMPPGAIVQAVRQAAARLDAEAVAARTAVKNRDRDCTLTPDADDQATVTLVGPAVPLTRWHAGLDARARALKAVGDPRTLAQLRFDLAVASTPCLTHPPADSSKVQADADAATAAATAEPTAPLLTAPAAAPVGEPADGPAGEPVVEGAAFGLRPNAVEAASTDCRFTRPVQANLTLPVETALGLSNEPGWLDGYGWLSAATCRLLLPDAELRRICAQNGTGQLVHVDDRVIRPAPTPAGVRQAVLDIVLDDVTLGRGSPLRGDGRPTDLNMADPPDPPDPGLPPADDPAWTVEPDHDPSVALARFVRLRDRVCDGPTQTLVPARRADLDHDTPWPDGPTAAWNLTARSRRTHLLKHYGWTPLRTATSTFWISPAGQTVEVPRHQQPPPGADTDHDGWLGTHDTDSIGGDSTGDTRPVLPDPDQLAATDLASLTPRDDTDLPPRLPATERPAPGHWHDLATSPTGGPDDQPDW